MSQNSRVLCSCGRPLSTPTKEEYASKPIVAQCDCGYRLYFRSSNIVSHEAPLDHCEEFKTACSHDLWLKYITKRLGRTP